MPIDTAAVIKELRRLVSGEVWHKTVFTVTRDDDDITVTIYDGGPEQPNARYYAKAESSDRSDGRKWTVGNPSESVLGALQAVHWNEVA